MVWSYKNTVSIVIARSIATKQSKNEIASLPFAMTI